LKISEETLKYLTTRETPAGFEPSFDYVITKILRFAFEKLFLRTARVSHVTAGRE